MPDNPAPRRHFAIEDQWHAETIGRFESFQAALDELTRLAAIPWDQQPNKAPCVSWQTCGRKYEILEWDTSDAPWALLSKADVLDVSAEGAKWLGDFGRATH